MKRLAILLFVLIVLAGLIYFASIPFPALAP